MRRHLLLLAALAAAPLVQAQDGPFSHFGAHVGIGTTGPRVGVVTNVTERINLRVSASMFSEDYLQPIGIDIDSDQDLDGNAFNLDNEIDFQQVGVLADVFLFSGVHLTGGVFFADRNVASTLRATEDIEEGGRTFTPDEVGTLRLDGKLGSSVSPYLGLGFGNAVGTNRGPVRLFAEVGGYFNGSPDIALSAEDPDSVIAPSANADNEVALEERLDWFTFYPEVAVGLSIKFN